MLVVVEMVLKNISQISNLLPIWEQLEATYHRLTQIIKDQEMWVHFVHMPVLVLHQMQLIH